MMKAEMWSRYNRDVPGIIKTGKGFQPAGYYSLWRISHEWWQAN